MPKHLLQRLRADSIAEYRSAARRRFLEASSLAEAGERLGAVYLFGYVVEMQLKAAYFRIAGFGLEAPILRADRRNAMGRAASLGMNWVGNEHDIGSWSELLVRTRRSIRGLAYGVQLERQVLSHAREVSARWRETIRYHANEAYRFELAAVRNAAEWFVRHTTEL